MEKKRDILIQGLCAIARALRPAAQVAQAAVERAAVERAELAAKIPTRAGEGASGWCQAYVDQDGRPLFEVERVYRSFQRQVEDPITLRALRIPFALGTSDFEKAPLTDYRAHVTTIENAQVGRRIHHT